MCSCYCPQVSQYLEGYLWPYFDPATSSDGHVMSILVMVNEKFREGVPAWTGFHSRKVRCHSSSTLPARLAVVCRSCSLAVLCLGGESCSSRSIVTSVADNRNSYPRLSAACVLQEVFPAFFARVLALRLPERQTQLAQHEQTAYLLFMINAFQSLEDEMVRGQVRQPASGCLSTHPPSAHKLQQVLLMAAHTRTPAYACVQPASTQPQALSSLQLAVPRQGS